MASESENNAMICYQTKAVGFWFRLVILTIVLLMVVFLLSLPQQPLIPFARDDVRLVAGMTRHDSSA